MPPSFKLGERSAFGAGYSWRLKESEIRFRGTGEYEFLVRRRIPATDEQIASFFAALDLIQVWEWRSHYDPSDIDATVDDGSSWMFKASNDDREVRCGGANAYPSFADSKVTTLDYNRFALLRAAFFDCFRIQSYIYEAKRFTELSNQSSSESPDDENE